MGDYILETQNLVFEYPDGTKALDDVSIKIKKGHKVAVLGSNGAGKSTLFLNFNGIFRPKQGVVRFKGEVVRYNHRSLCALRQKVGVVFQDPETQLFSSSVFQEVSFGPMNLNLHKDEVIRRVNKALVQTGVEELKGRPTHFLSHGQKKRVSISDILAMEPEVIIFDEPTDCLDPKHTLQIFELFEQLNQEGTTIIFSTHDVDLAYAWADEIIVMQNGRVIGCGNPIEVFSDNVLLEQTELLTPMVMDIFSELKLSGFLDENNEIPRSKDKLLEIIRNKRKSN